MALWREQLERAVIGELQGEAYFSSMADQLSDDRQVQVLRRCAEPERPDVRTGGGGRRGDGVRTETTAIELIG